MWLFPLRLWLSGAVKPTWRKIRSWITPVRFVLGIGVALLSWYVITEATRRVVLIEAIAVPKQLEELGFTSQVITLRVAEKLEQLEQNIHTSEEKDTLKVDLLSGDHNEIPDVEVPSPSISLRTLVSVTQQLLGSEPTRILGEITWPGDPANSDVRKAMFWYHIYHGQQLRWAEKQAVDTRNPDVIVQLYAEGLMKRLNPYVWALYLCWTKNDLEAGESVIDNLIAFTTDPTTLARDYELRGDVAYQRGNRDEAIEDYKRSADVAPKRASSALTSWATILEEEKKHSEAENVFWRAINSNRRDPYPYEMWGRVLEAENKPDEAIEKYRQAIRIDKRESYAYALWAVILQKQGEQDRSKMREAIEKYRRAISYNPRLAVPYYNWGTILDDEGNRDQAIDRYRRTVQVDPQYANAYYHWAVLLDKNGEHSQALQRYKQAAEADPKKYESAYLTFEGSLRQAAHSDLNK